MKKSCVFSQSTFGLTPHEPPINKAQNNIDILTS